MVQEMNNADKAPTKSIVKGQEPPVSLEVSTFDGEAKPELKPRVVHKKPFTERMKMHRFFLVRAVYYIFYSVWAVVMAIGMLIAWLIAMLFI